MGGATHCPSQGPATSRERMMVECRKGRTDKPARERVHRYKTLELKGELIHMSGHIAREECRIIHIVLFCVGLSVVCNL